jgi:hypothetical protein
MLASVVITFAAFALLQLATQQTSRARDFVQASQTGRTAMTHIVDELNSACVAENAAPVLPTSKPEELYFVTAFSKKSEIQPSEVQEHRLYWKEAPAGSGIGGLYDAEAAAETKTGEHEWKFKELPPVGTLIDANVVRYKNPKTGQPEIFKYYKYSLKTEENGTAGLSALVEIERKPGEELKAEATKVASVTINFRSLPSDNSEKLGRDAELSSQVTFAFSAGFTEPEVTSKFACENQ